jgi:hypothetical protein
VDKCYERIGERIKERVWIMLCDNYEKALRKCCWRIRERIKGRIMLELKKGFE